MTDCVSARFPGRLYLAPGDQRSCKGCSQKIGRFINGVASEGRPYEILDKVLGQIVNNHFIGPGFQSLFSDAVQFFPLA